jgi:predicted amidophosphoribosyltransferase
VGLSAQKRRQNVRGSFSLSPDVAVPMGSRLVLIDDVRTTGSTVSACVDVLKALRPSRIEVVTLATELSRETMEALGIDDELGS